MWNVVLICNYTTRGVQLTSDSYEPSLSESDFSEFSELDLSELYNQIKWCGDESMV